MTELETVVAVLGQRMSSNEAREVECRTANYQEHEELFARMRALEVGLATLQVRVAFWATTATVVSSILVQVAFKLWQ